jgi:hypothetical protein
MNQAEPTPAYMPSWPEARQALQSALSGWRDAPTPLPASLDTDAVKFLDRQRKPGQRLRAFDILAQTETENARQFTVRLTLEGLDPQIVKYNVLGRAPVWVFRLDDYENFAHWEMDMGAPQSAPGEAIKKSVAPTKAGATD